MPTEDKITIRVRYVETDQMGYVHHSYYPVYFEMGRTELLRKSGISYREMEEAGIFFVVVKLEIKYIYPARYDDELILTTTLTRITRARIDHEYRLYRKSDNRLLAEAKTTLACVDREGILSPIPETFNKYLTDSQVQ